MLSVPPAFVLSQDQTLYKNSISKQLSSLWNQSCSITLALLLRIFYSLLEFFFFQRNLKGRYFSCIVQFSRCCFAFCLLSSTAFLLYHIFNRLSSTFSSFFKKLFRTLDFRCLSSDSLSIISHLSEFVKWFLKSFLFNFLRGYFHFPLSKFFRTFSTRPSHLCDF